MKKENMVMFRVSLYDCDNPQKLANDIRPKNHITDIWIPQTMGDQVWLWFEFANKEDKNNYIEWINNCDVSCTSDWGKGNVDINYPKDMMCQDEEHWTQKEIDHWCN